MPNPFVSRALFPLLLALLFAAGAVPAANIDDIERRGKLRLAICAEDLPPFSFRENGEWKGYDIDLAAGLARELGVALDIRVHPDWEGVVGLVHSGEADIGMSCLSISPERSRQVAFSTPYIRLKQGILANQVALMQLPGKTNMDKIRSPKASIAVRRSGVYETLLPKYLPEATAALRATWDECYTMARSGEVTGVIGDEAQLLTWLARVKGDSMRLIPVLFEDKSDPIAIAVPVDAPHFLSYVNAFLELNQYSGTMQDLHWKYRSEGASESTVAGRIARSEYPPLILSIVVALCLAYYFIRSAR